MTKKDYELVAGIIAKLPAETSKALVVVNFTKALAANSSRFKADKFVAWCIAKK